MKLITLHQPWASLVALGLKQYETRHWPTDYRGELLIHAAARPMRTDEINSLYAALEDYPWWSEHLDTAFTQDLPLGRVVAVCNLFNCQKIVCGKGQSSLTPLERAVGNWAEGRYAFHLTDAIALPNPIPYTSRQGKLLSVPSSLIAMVGRQIKQPSNIYQRRA